MQISDILNSLFRYLHVAAGVIWIGHLYFFNFVNAHFAATMDGETKKKVVPELLPRALFWFRWGAAYTWVTGLILMLLVFYHGGLMFDDPTQGWMTGSIVMVALTFLAFAVYDVLAKSALGKNQKVFAAISFVLIVVVVFLMQWKDFSGFGYRAYVIHLGAMFGTLMAANVWMRIWPSQKKIIAAIKGGTPPDASLVALAGARSKHNTYMSVPLLWTMINSHTVTFSGSWLYLIGAVAIGWLLVWFVYKRSAKVKGF